ncbi:putative 20.8 kDa protein in FGF-VUBI intergenic region, partial [Dissostichus eleginoides]
MLAEFHSVEKLPAETVGRRVGGLPLTAEITTLPINPSKPAPSPPKSGLWRRQAEMNKGAEEDSEGLGEADGRVGGKWFSEIDTP